MSASRKELESSLNKLSLSPQNQPKPSSKKTHKAPIADSWEDDSSGSDTESETSRPLTAQSSASYPDPPPPTPISPTSPYGRNDADRFISPYAETWNTAAGSSVSPRAERERGSDRRPEKTDAVAKRLIAGALGVRAPKKTEEQRSYERAVKEKEIKRIKAEKDEARRKEEESERAKAAAWSD